MGHFKLYEEFNPYTGKAFIEKLRLYALASDSTKKVTPVVVGKGILSFNIETTIPADFQPTGVKSFEVIVPTNIKDSPYVETYENGKLVLTTSIEVENENEIDLILINFIEATQLYNDGPIQDIVDAVDRVKTPKDIKDIIKTRG